MIHRTIVAALALSSSVAVSAQTTAAVPTGGNIVVATEKPGSAYVQCDGQPNNTTAGETTARLIGAITLLGLFAPPPEAADASKRKLGAEGVAVCTSLLDGEKREGNPQRRTGLLLARAIHHFEAKNYDAAIADTRLAREEAKAAGYTDRYYARETGRSFDLIEAAAIYRKGDVTGARAMALRDALNERNSIFLLSRVPAYMLEGPDDARETEYRAWKARAASWGADEAADRHEMFGRVAESARLRDALVDYAAARNPEQRATLPIARAALAHALAGNATRSKTLADEARANLEARRAAGKPDAEASAAVELIDLQSIVEAQVAGDVNGARRRFGARSQWTSAPFGSVVEMVRRLRPGATADELAGELARTPEAMIADRTKALRAQAMATDTDNKTLFTLVTRGTPASSFEAMSKRVWNVDKSKLVLKLKEPRRNRFDILFDPLAGFDVAPEAYMLHAALLAKSRGHAGFVALPFITNDFLAMSVLTGNMGEPGLPEPLFTPADGVVTDLSALIPDPETLAARRKTASRPR